MALSKVDLANQVENQLPQNLVANNLPFRNIIINGDMSIAQRGTSTSGITSTTYVIDRNQFRLSGLGTWTVSQDTDVPTGQGFFNSMKMECTTADASPASSDFCIFNQIIEGQNLQYLKKGTSSAESLTMSFWVKSNKTGTYIAELWDGDNNRSISKSYTIDSADTWEKKIITFEGDTTGAFDNDNGASVYARTWLGAGSTFTSGTLQTSWGASTSANKAVGQVNLADAISNYINITGFQLEAGTTASDFEFLPYDVNLARCQRYCYSETPGDANHAVSNGYYGSSTLFITVKELPVSMRANPSLTTTGNWQVSSVANITITSFSLVDNVIKNINTIQIRGTVASGGVAGDGGMIRNANDATATFILSSEL
jgi:hypothetical protein